MTVKTRFAPSPTGMLHIGGARTALFCWLYARRHRGVFVLRIEDTDRERSTPEAVQVILDGMRWLGLDWDEGPYYQSERGERYREMIDWLLDNGHAYRCYCTREELEQMREEQLSRKEKPHYDGRCRQRTKPREGVDPVIRFKNPEQGATVVNDAVRGRVTFDNRELDDLIIARSDGSPTYNFCVVVDDMDMGITHVIRGDDHLNNTPRQMNILKALGVEPPEYAHLPMILGPDGAKLSKRHGAASVLNYREEGYLPEAVVNYLVRLGWAHGDQEIFSREEMIELFDVADVNHSASAINPEKLTWLNQHYMKEGDPGLIGEELRWQLQRMGVDPSRGPALADVVVAQRERTKTLKEMAERSAFFYAEFDEYDDKAARKQLNDKTLPFLQALKDRLDSLEEWSAEAVHAVVQGIAEENQVGMGKVAQPLRVAVSGTTVSPPIDWTLELLGRERTLARLDRAIGTAKAVAEGR